MKFVNDFFIGDLKIGGVLCKGELMGDQWTLQMGIGVNLNVEREFYLSQGLTEASSVFAETGMHVDVGAF